MSDETMELSRRAAAGDAEAVEALLERFLPSLRAFVRAHMSPQLRARESSSDVVQSTCRELFAHQERFQHPGEDAFRHWLFTTARRKIANRARDFGRLKREAAREEAFESLDAVGRVVSGFSSPSGQVLRKDELERLEAAIDGLAPEQREVLTLAYMAGLSRAEIGRQLGKTEEAVRAMLHRAVARLSIRMAD